MHALGRIGIVAMIVVASMGVARPATVTRYTGMFSDGATYLIQAPSNWNGTLLLFSHGYIIPGQPNPAVDTSDPVSGKYLLAHGYALAGSSYASTGWAVADALPDQMNVRPDHGGTHSTVSGELRRRAAAVRCHRRQRRHVEYVSRHRVCFQYAARCGWAPGREHCQPSAKL
jgi:hypothetical protein